MNKIKILAILLLTTTANTLLSQKIILCGTIKKSHIQKIESIIGQLQIANSKTKLYLSESNPINTKKINLNSNIGSQLNIDDQNHFSKSDLVQKISHCVTLSIKDNPKKKILLVCINKFVDNIPLPFNCERITPEQLLQNSAVYKKAVVILALTPNFIEFTLNEPSNEIKIEESIIDLKGTIKSNADISSIRYQFGTKGWQTIDPEQLNYKDGEISFWLQDQWPFKSNLSNFIYFEIIDTEGNKSTTKHGPFTKINKDINSSNCYFKYYEKDLHDVALVKYFKNSNVYWFPIYSEVDPSNLSFVLIDKLGKPHISIRFEEDINFVKSSTNEYCIGIACGNLNIGPTNCECHFDGTCVLVHNETKSKSLPIEIHLKDWKPSYIGPLAECSK
jgi:hypothetical protein